MKRKSLIAMALVILALAVWTFRPYPTIDESRVHPLLRGLDGSTKCAWTSFGDGGSMVIHIQPLRRGEVQAS